MKKVLLLGDSIRMGYQEKVEELLKDEYKVYYPVDNGRFVSYTLWQANQMFKEYGHFDIVHWNNGYWDMNIEAPMKEAMTPIDEYTYFLKRIIRLCRENSDKIIFATTLPVPMQGLSSDVTDTGGNIRYNNDWVRQYNDAAIRVMNEENVFVNDLYSLVLKDENFYKCPDKLHLTSQGYNICANMIADIIKEVDNK